VIQIGSGEEEKEQIYSTGVQSPKSNTCRSTDSCGSTKRNVEINRFPSKTQARRRRQSLHEMGPIPDEERDPYGMGCRAERSNPRWRLLVASAYSANARLRPDATAIPALDVHRTKIERSRRRLRHRERGCKLDSIEQISPAPPSRRRDGSRSVCQTRIQEDLGNEAENRTKSSSAKVPSLQEKLARKTPL